MTRRLRPILLLPLLACACVPSQPNGSHERDSDAEQADAATNEASAEQSIAGNVEQRSLEDRVSNLEAEVADLRAKRDTDAIPARVSTLEQHVYGGAARGGATTGGGPAAVASPVPLLPGAVAPTPRPSPTATRSRADRLGDQLHLP